MMGLAVRLNKHKNLSYQISGSVAENWAATRAFYVSEYVRPFTYCQPTNLTYHVAKGVKSC